MEKVKTIEETVESTTGLTPRFESEEAFDAALELQRQKESGFSHALRIDFLNRDQINVLKEQVSKSNGTVRVLVHPNHLGPDEDNRINDEGNVNYEGYPPLEVLKRTIFKRDVPPTMLLIDESDFDYLREKYEEKAIEEKSEVPVYMAPTLDGQGSLKIFGLNDPKNSKELEEYSLTGMSTLVPLFSHLGIQKIIVGGSMLKVGDEGVSHCVGSFIGDFRYINKHMVDHSIDNIQPIKIEVGAATVPHGRKELREHGFEEFL